MKNCKKLRVVISVICFLLILNTAKAASKIKILVVDSYHPEYLWSQETNRGFLYYQRNR